MIYPNEKLSEMNGSEEKLIQGKPYGFLRCKIYETKSLVYGTRRRAGMFQCLTIFLDGSPVWTNENPENYHAI